MNLKEILNRFQTENDIDNEIITSFKDNGALCKELIDYSRQIGNKAFALTLLNKFITIRQDPNGIMPGELLMFACFNLAMHQQVEDCLKIWEAKQIDFDTYCGLDIQLVPFVGVEKTISFLKSHSGDEAKTALEYIIECRKCGDFDTLNDYYSGEHYPWFL